MKNDPMFKFLAVTVLIGAIIAIVSPTHAIHESAGQEAASTTSSLAE